jgi:hypothetical protein
MLNINEQTSKELNVMPGLNAAVIPQTGPMKLYIGSIHVNINEDTLRGIFEPFGSVSVI